MLIAVVPFAARPFLGFSVDAFDTVSVGGFAGSLFGVLVLVAVPVTLLGAAAPWAVRLAVGEVDRSGEVVGRLYAISTAGSLFGTMISALLLIPLLGTQRTFLVFALALALVARRRASAGASPSVPAAAGAGAARSRSGRSRPPTPAASSTRPRPPTSTRGWSNAPDGSRALELNEGQAVHSL